MKAQFVPEIEILTKIKAFSSFDSEIFDAICKTGTRRSFKPGEQILERPGENASSLIIVNEGKLRIILSGSDKTYILLSFLITEDYWGEFGLLDGNNLKVEIFAEEQSDVTIFSRQTLMDNLGKNQEIFIKLVKQLAAKLRESHFKLDSLKVKDSDAKVARTVIKLGLESGSVKANMLEIDHLPLPADFAKMAGISTETLTRTLQSFAKKSLVETEENKLRIKDFIKLKELLN